jgi:hypothetical protein
MIENWGSICVYVWPETTVVVVFGHRRHDFAVGRPREIAGASLASDADGLAEQSGAPPPMWRDGVRPVGRAAASERQFKVCQTFN